MKSLKGVIAATTYADYQTPLADSNLFIEPWYFILTSLPYALEHVDSASGTFNTLVELAPPPSGISAAGLSNITIKARLINTVEYGEYRHPLSEAAGLTGITFKASLIKTVEYGEYRHPLTEAAGLTNITFKASLISLMVDIEVPPESASGTYNTEVTLVPA